MQFLLINMIKLFLFDTNYINMKKKEVVRVFNFSHAALVTKTNEKIAFME